MTKKNKNTKIVFGVDEAGRGPLAGPVYACALCLKNPPRLKTRAEDSKKLSKKQREAVYKEIKENKNIIFATGKAGVKMIDKINIFNASKLAMERAVYNLLKKAGEEPKMILLDGNFKLNLPFPQRSFIKGDGRILSIKMASIAAKVERDRYMKKLAKKFPRYGLERNMGYGTLEHRNALKKRGRTSHHRQSFRVRIKGKQIETI